MLTVVQYIILGIIQGITEWLPISSSAMSTLVMTNFFGISEINVLLQESLFLHLGTLLAVLIYFRKDVWEVLVTMFRYSSSSEESQKILKFLLISTLISGILGLFIFKTLLSFESSLEITGKTITFFVGILLLFTGIIQLKVKTIGLRKENNLQNSDGVLLGVVQGAAFMPGISRSGITISTLLLKKFEETTALKLSFLMSIPVVLLGNLLLNLNDFAFTTASLYGLLASFVLGILTIHFLMSLSRKINFGWFVLIFATLMLGSLFV